MNQDITDKYQTLIDFIQMEKHRGEMTMKLYKKDEQKQEYFIRSLGQIRDYMDLLSEDYSSTGNQSKGMGVGNNSDNFQEEEEEKNPQDQLQPRTSSQLLVEEISQVMQEFRIQVEKRIEASQGFNNEIKSMVNTIHLAINSKVNNDGGQNNHQQLWNGVQKLMDSFKMQYDEDRKILQQQISKVGDFIAKIPRNDQKFEEMSEQILKVGGRLEAQINTYHGFQMDRAQTIKSTIDDKVLKGLNQISKQLENLQLKNPKQQNGKYQPPQIIYQQPMRRPLTQQRIMIQIEFKPKALQLLDKPEKVAAAQLYSKPMKVIMVCDNGNIVIGGDEKKLYKYSPTFELLLKKDINNSLGDGLAVGNYLYCYIYSNSNYKITIFDQMEMKVIKTVTVQNEVMKMMILDNENIIVCQDDGCLDIINIITQSNILSEKIDVECINDIVKNNQGNEYLIATGSGIHTINLQKKQNVFTLTLKKEDAYLPKDNVTEVLVINRDALLAAVQFEQSLFVVSRKSKQVTAKIGQFDGTYNCVKKIVNFNENTFPYVIVKDQSSISIVNTLTMDWMEFKSSKFFGEGYSQSLAINYDENGNINMMSFSTEQKKQYLELYTIAKLI